MLGIDIGEGCDAANINNAIRELMAELKTKLDAQDSSISSGASGAQPLDATLTALAAVTTATDELIYATDVDTFTTTAFSSFVRGFLGSADVGTMLSTLGFAYSSTGTPGSSGWKVTIDLPLAGSTSKLRVNMGIKSVTANTLTTDSMLNNFSTVFGGVGSASSFSSGENENAYVGGATTSAISIYNSRSSTTNYFWVAFGLA